MFLDKIKISAKEKKNILECDISMSSVRSFAHIP